MKVDMQWVVARNSKIHGKGLYARKDIPEGTKVIEYVGKKITKAQSDKRADVQLDKHTKNSEVGSVYLFTLNKQYDIDGYVPWNPARLANHSCDPNCDTENVKGHIWIMSFKDIKKGDEITYDYGYDIESYEDHPCKCGAKKCVGYIVDENQWPRLKRLLAKKKSRRNT